MGGVSFLGDLIKIIMGLDPDSIDYLLNHEEFELSAVDSKIGDWFKKVWAKVKPFFDKLGHQIKEFFDNLESRLRKLLRRCSPRKSEQKYWQH